MRIIKWVFGGLAAINVILGLAWVMVLKDRIINFALDQVEAQIGRDISVGGDADLKIFPNLVVVADQVSVANADWSDRGAMMTADRFDDYFRLLPWVFDGLCAPIHDFEPR